MLVDPKVYLSRLQDLDLKNAYELSSALEAAAKGANRITILSAYYGAEYLANAFASLPKKERRNCALTLVFGIDHPRQMPSILRDLRALRVTLLELGFPRPAISVFGKNAPFHTKLFYFRKGTQPVWFVGSANASNSIEGNRHEMMLRLSGSHKGLTSYVDAIIAGAMDLDEPEPRTTIVRDLRSFFLRGSLCYAPASRMNLTFEACRIEAHHRNVLKQNLADASNVPHAEPQTEGFGFSLSNAAAQISNSRTFNIDEENGPEKVKFKHLALETIYGFWLPQVYAEEIREKLDQATAKRTASMIRFGEVLKDISHSKLETELENHVSGLKAFFESHGAPIEPKTDYRSRFSLFLQSRSSWLSDPARVERMARRLHIEQMPDIWNDVDAAEKFESSCFEDLSYRFGGARGTRIIDLLKAELSTNGVISPEALKKALFLRLKKGFNDATWSRKI